MDGQLTRDLVLGVLVMGLALAVLCWLGERSM